ncbi:MAG: protein kinase [Planctomycetia bacterium]
MTANFTRCEHCVLIPEYVAGRLADSACEDFEQHVEDCAECLRLLSQMLQTSTSASWNRLIAPLAARRYSGNGYGSKIPCFNSEVPLRKGLDTDGDARQVQESIFHAPAMKDGQSPDAGMVEQGVSTERAEHLRYRRIRLAGAGGMGLVWEAWDEKMQRRVAIKSLRNLEADFHETERLIQEATVLARLSHPNIVTVYELSESNGRPALILEYVDGPTLADQLRGQPVGESDAVSLLLRIAAAVGHAHRCGVIHRDLKPSNILIKFPESADRNNVCLQDVDVKVTDFGLARVLDQQTMTHTGQLMGTPCYMSPEQVSGDPELIGPRSDIYGLGTILYELLTGRPPFVADDPAVTMSMIRQHNPVPPRMLSPRLSRDVELVCLKCLSKAPKDRYESVEYLLEDLQAMVDGHPVKARPINDWIRLYRWICRNQRLAAMGFFSLLTVVAMITLSLLFAASEKSLREKASEAEALALRNADKAEKNAEIAGRAAVEARKNSDLLKLQQQSAMSGMQRLLLITQSPDSFVRSMNSESKNQFFAEAMRAYREYFEFAGMDSPLTPDELNSAIIYVWLLETAAPQQSVQKEVAWIQDNIKRVRSEGVDEQTLLNFEIRLYELIARDSAHHGDLNASADAYIAMAAMIRQSTESQNATSPQYSGSLRNSADMLMNAAGMLSHTQRYEDSLRTIGEACALYEHLMQLNPESDLDAIRLTNYRYAAVSAYHLMQNDTAALQAAEAALAFSSQYQIHTPELAAEFEQAKQNHSAFIHSQTAKSGQEPF